MKEPIIFALSIMVLAPYFYISFLLITHNGQTDPQNAMLVYGSVSALAGGVMTYWFGSTVGSARKDKTIETMANKQGERQ